MDRADRRSGVVPVPRARWLAPVAVAAGLVLAATALAASPVRVANVVGKPIPRREFNHWMLIAAKGQGGPLIVPTDPPRFSHCIALARADLPSVRHDSTRALRKDCRLVFTALSQSVLDFLIRADWQEVQAAHDGIVITAEQVERTFAGERQRLFPKPAQFRRFLRRTGQNVDDIKARVHAHVVFKALQRTEHLSPDALEAELTRRFKPRTTCARYYVMSDCAQVAASGAIW